MRESVLIINIENDGMRNLLLVFGLYIYRHRQEHVHIDMDTHFRACLSTHTCIRACVHTHTCTHHFLEKGKKKTAGIK